MNGETTDQQLAEQDFTWRLWPLVPLYPYGKRRTLRTEVVPDTLWTFDQMQGILYVAVPIRMTVVRLAEGGLLVYAPIAPTPECIRLVNELVITHGDVKYIILPTVSGLEHKVFVGPFARHFATAQVFVAPNQWSFPLNLPLSWLGFPIKRTHVLPADSEQAPFARDFDYAILGPINLGLGSFGEVAFFHRSSQTLLVTDSVLSVPKDPPAIVQLHPYSLLFHAREYAVEPVADSPANRQKGWQRTTLFAFYFRPKALKPVDLRRSLRDAWQAPDRSPKAYFGWFPFGWKADWQRSFDALHANGRLFVAPILQTLILNRAPQETLTWVDRVAHWDFQQIVPCHFDSPIAASPVQFQRAFAFLKKSTLDSEQAARDLLPQEDFELLHELDELFRKTGIVPPAKDKV